MSTWEVLVVCVDAIARLVVVAVALHLSLKSKALCPSAQS